MWPWAPSLSYDPDDGSNMEAAAFWLLVIVDRRPQENRLAWTLHLNSTVKVSVPTPLGLPGPGHRVNKETSSKDRERVPHGAWILSTQRTNSTPHNGSHMLEAIDDISDEDVFRWLWVGRDSTSNAPSVLHGGRRTRGALGAEEITSKAPRRCILVRKVDPVDDRILDGSNVSVAGKSVGAQ